MGGVKECENLSHFVAKKVDFLVDLRGHITHRVTLSYGCANIHCLQEKLVHSYKMLSTLANTNIFS